MRNALCLNVFVSDVEATGFSVKSAACGRRVKLPTPYCEERLTGRRPVALATGLQIHLLQTRRRAVLPETREFQKIRSLQFGRAVSMKSRTCLLLATSGL